MNVSSFDLELQRHAQVLLLVLLSVIVDTGPSGVRLMVALPVLKELPGQRVSVAEIFGSFNLVEQPTLLILPLPVRAAPPLQPVN